MDEFKDLHNQVAELQKKAIELAQKKRELIHEDMKKKISLYDFTAKELGFVEKVVSIPAGTTTKTPVAIKYRQGDFTWTGRRRQPKFIIDHLATGGKLKIF